MARYGKATEKLTPRRLAGIGGATGAAFTAAEELFLRLPGIAKMIDPVRCARQGGCEVTQTTPMT
jgi:hypothetical protein